MIIEPWQGEHFKERFSERFQQKAGFDIHKVEMVSKFSTNRYQHPKIKRWLESGRAPKYLVSKQHNIVVPVGLDGRMITALWYNGRPKR